MSIVGSISEIWRYPVSSLGGEQLASATFDEDGIAEDRQWGVVDSATNTVARPAERRWRTIPEVTARTGPDGPEIRVPGDEWRTVRDVGAAGALTRHFGFPADVRRHVRFEAEEPPGTVAPRYRRAQLHLLTTASMRALRNYLPPDSLVDPRRFRPNIVVATSEEFDGFIEADWLGRELALGDAIVRVTEPCERCVFTTLAQGDLPFDKAILSAIARHGGGGFGALCTIVDPNPIAVGEPVRLA